MMARLTLYTLLALCLVTLAACVTYQPTWESIDSRPLPDWYDKAKVGVFLHWGVFSVPSYSTEWFWGDGENPKAERYPVIQEYIKKNEPPGFKYQDFAKDFKAELYDPVKWANTFKNAGMKYVVLTSKHHEGYVMWPTTHSPDWNVGDVGPHRDLLGELAKAVKAVNLTFGAYHSWMEWHNPLWEADQKNGLRTHDFITQKIRPLLEELVTKYHPSLLWFDGDAAPDTYWNSTHFLAWLYNESPVKDVVVVNDRFGGGTACKHGGFYNCEDRFTPDKVINHKWENCQTMDSVWGYRREAMVHDYKTPEWLIQNMVSTVAFGGNYLINIGPARDGTIMPLMEERLLQMGKWLQVNGEAIYESHPHKVPQDPVNKSIYYTERAGKLYGIATNYADHLEFGAIEYDHVKSVTLLGHNGPVTFTKAGAGHVAVQMPHYPPVSNIMYAWTFHFEMK